MKMIRLAILFVLVVAAAAVWRLAPGAIAQEATPAAECGYVDGSPIRLVGSGDTVSEPFHMDEGNFIITLEHDYADDSLPVATFYAWPGDGAIFGIFGGSTDVIRNVGTIYEAGDYVLNINVGTDWTITIEQ